VTGPATAKLRLPMDVFVLGTWRMPLVPDCSCQRPRRVETQRQNSLKYEGASDHTDTAMLAVWIQFVDGPQANANRATQVWCYGRISMFKINRAAAFWKGWPWFVLHSYIATPVERVISSMYMVNQFIVDFLKYFKLWKSAVRCLFVAFYLRSEAQALLIIPNVKVSSTLYSILFLKFIFTSNCENFLMKNIATILFWKISL